MKKSKILVSGQASIEYLLMTLVVIAMIVPMVNLAKERFLGLGLECTPETQTIMCQIERALTFEGNFRYFTVKR